MTGFSFTNLHYCRRFFKFYFQTMDDNIVIPISPQVGGNLQMPDKENNIILPQFGGELETYKISLIPWGHQKTIIDKCKDINQALFYIDKTIENNWSRAVLEYQIESNLYGSQRKAVTVIAGFPSHVIVGEHGKIENVIAGMTRNPLKHLQRYY